MYLITHRLTLRELVEHDWQAVLAYQSKPDYLRLQTWEERTEQDVQAFIQQFITWQQEQPRTKFQFAITLSAKPQQLIGICGIRKETVDSQEADVGYEIDPSFWGHGYATETARKLLAFGFDELQLHRIWAWTLLDNVASSRVLEKLGMQREGQLRQNRWIKGRWRDSVIYGILRDEWAAR